MKDLEVDRKEVTTLSVFLAVGGLSNLFFLLALVLTWKYWRQVKWYVGALAAGNWLELVFRFGTELGWHHTLVWRERGGGGSQLSCKLLMMLRLLGPSVSLTTLVALSFHVLLTVLTGQQGTRIRHGILLGLAWLLALPLPLFQIVMFRLLPLPWDSERQQCVTFGFFKDRVQWFHYIVAFHCVLVYIPLFLFIVCEAASCSVYAARKGHLKGGDEHYSDLVLTGLLGLVAIVCCLPFYTYHVIERQDGQLTYWLENLDRCRNVFTALISAGFAYLYVYRKRGKLRGDVIPTTTTSTTNTTKTTSTTNTTNTTKTSNIEAATGERQRLVTGGYMYD